MDPTADPRFHDHVALTEIELYAEVLTAVAEADDRLSQTELDRALGLLPEAEPAPSPARFPDHPGPETSAPQERGPRPREVRAREAWTPRPVPAARRQSYASPHPLA